MSLSYNLPRELIAQIPIDKRDKARLLILNRATGRITHRIFKNIVEILDEGYLIVLNNTKVFPARLFGRREGGEKIEVLLVKEKEPLVWEALGRPAKRLKKGCRINFDTSMELSINPERGELVDHGDFSATVLEDINSNNNHSLLQFNTSVPLMEILNKYGYTPLPPYIKRPIGPVPGQRSIDDKRDRERYQTVYAKRTGSCACPTAGLHFTEELLNALKKKGAGTAEVTLHIGPGTFRPIKTDNLEDYRMEEEFFIISKDVAQAINSAKKRGIKIVACGTSSVRALEQAGSSGDVLPGEGDAGVFIRPGYKFKIVDCLITNFHQPNSTPLALVTAFAGRDLVSTAYSEAIKERYRFFSYGDSMFII